MIIKNVIFYNLFVLQVTDSNDGVAWERKESNYIPDAVVDYWHPLKKAQYPDYFAKREERKKEFVEWYNKTYGKPTYEAVE